MTIENYMENRRQFTRILFSIEATLTVDDYSYPVSIHDISLNGALVTTPLSETSLKGKFGVLSFALISKHSDIELDNTLNITPNIEMHIAIVHEKDGVTGLQCNAIDIDSVTHLRRLVELNLGDETQLEKELSQLTKAE